VDSCSRSRIYLDYGAWDRAEQEGIETGLGMDSYCPECKWAGSTRGRLPDPSHKGVMKEEDLGTMQLVFEYCS